MSSLMILQCRGSHSPFVPEKIPSHSTTRAHCRSHDDPLSVCGEKQPSVAITMPRPRILDCRTATRLSREARPGTLSLVKTPKRTSIPTLQTYYGINRAFL